MTDSFASVIAQLERQKAAIERALAALREVDIAATAAPAKPAITTEAPARKRRKFSAASRRKMALAQKARWARINGETKTSSPLAPEPAKAKRRISAEGMKRIVAATKKRWRLQRAAARAAVAKEAAPPRAAPKKMVVKAASAKAVKKGAPLRAEAVEKPAQATAEAAG